MAENSVTLTGTLGGDPVRRTTEKGTLTRFSIAYTPRRRTENGWEDGTTSWFDVAVWGTLGEHALASLRKGQRAIVHGTVGVSQWTSDGQPRRAVQITATAVGHDLTFGTTQFTRAGAARPIEPPSAPQPQPQPQPQREPVPVGAVPATQEPGEPSDWGTQFADDAPF